MSSSVYIDGKAFTFEGTQHALPFILDRGMEIPFFCYHPSLSSPANCRQCLVKVGRYIRDRKSGKYVLDEHQQRQIQWFPKLMPSCLLELTDDMVILTQQTNNDVKRAQQDTLEFILINHPLDCPICDQAGECPLQITTYKYGPKKSRFEVKKVHKPKRIELGPRVILDAERCINCTRCIRFTDEVSKSHQLTIMSRGDKNYPTTAPNETFDDPYSMNTIDICPVGALTSADFRFKARVWEMSQTPSIDVSNAKGCNVDLWVRDNLVMRITPRYNSKVNDHWMPDSGRLMYHRFNENRVKHPSIRLNDVMIPTGWDNIYNQITELLQSHEPQDILFLGSPHASVEENYALKLLAEAYKIKQVYFVKDIEKGMGDNFLLTDDQAPNTNGCHLLGLKVSTINTLKNYIQKAKIIVTISNAVIDRCVSDMKNVEDKQWLCFATNHSTTTQHAYLVASITCAAEHEASYVNIDGRIQRTHIAKETRHINRRLHGGMSRSRLDRFSTAYDNWSNDDNKMDAYPLWYIVNQVLKRIDMPYHVNLDHSKVLMDHIAQTHNAYKGVSYEAMDKTGGIVLDMSSKK